MAIRSVRSQSEIIQVLSSDVTIRATPELQLENITNFSFLHEFTNLTRLDITRSITMCIYSLNKVLPHPEKLEQLNIFCSDVINLHFIGLFTNLKKLSIVLLDEPDNNPNDYPSIPNLEYFAPLKNLESLHIRNCMTESLKGLEHLTNLTDLDVSGNELTSMEEILSLKNLKNLRIGENCELEITRVPSTLEWLDINNSSVTNLEFLRPCSNLKNLECAGNEIESLKGIENLPITRMVLNDCCLSNLDYMPKSVVDLWTINNTLSNIDGLFDCVNLQSANLDDNVITSLEPLRNCVNLSHISIDDNQVESLKGLENCSEISSIDAQRNNLTNLDFLPINSYLNDLDFAENENLNNIDALYHCVKARESLSSLNLRDINYVGTLPNWLLEFTELVELIVDSRFNLTPELFARFGFNEMEGEDDNYAVYNDGQNVHNTVVHSSISASISAVMQEDKVDSVMEWV
jgi:internalin A